MDAKNIISRVKKAAKADEPPKAVVEVVVADKQEEFKRKAQVKKTAVPVREEVAKAGFSSSIFTANPEAPKIEKKSIVMKPVVVKQMFSDSSFPGIGIHPVLHAHLEKLKVIAPTEIQRVAIPTLTSVHNRDMIIQAQTGSGKTFSFLLPILNQLLVAGADLETKYGKEFFTRLSGAFAIILVPTRELAQQIASVLESLLRYTRNATEETSNYCRHWIVSGLISGGESKKSEKSRLRKGINILVATPGRLLDHLRTTESFYVGNLRWLVLDEADNLLHLGFEETLRDILQLLNEKGMAAVTAGDRPKVPSWPFERQTILCSATIEGGVEKLAETALRDPIFLKAKEKASIAPAKEGDVEVAEEKDVISIPTQLKQYYVLSPAKLRLVNLLGLIRHITDQGKKNCKIIVFIATGDSVDWHFDAINRITDTDRDDELPEIELNASDEALPLVYNDLPKLRLGYESKYLPNCRLFKLHGSLQQSERHAIFTGFSPTVSTSSSVLFCTDVAARGLDVADVTHVIQYDPPADVRDYIHRIGRTARLGKDGFAYLFLLPSEVEYLDLLEDYRCRLSEQPIDEILNSLVPLATTAVAKKAKFQRHEIAATDVHMAFERFVQSNQTNLLHAQKAFSSHIRAYTTHLASERHIFHIRKLHLGHLAKSFCLREAPAALQSKLGNLAKSIKETDNASGGGVTANSMKRKAIMMASNMMKSEFSSGDPANATFKKKK